MPGLTVHHYGVDVANLGSITGRYKRKEYPAHAIEFTESHTSKGGTRLQGTLLERVLDVSFYSVSTVQQFDSTLSLTSL